MTTPSKAPPPPAYVAGLDLGQTADPTALAVLKKVGVGRKAVYTLLALRRFELQTPYPTIVDDVGKVTTAAPLIGAPLVIDQTGVGRPVVDLARERLADTWIVPVTITGGAAATEAEDGYHVPKKELVTALALVHQTQRLIVPKKLAHGPTLAREMKNFRVKITAAANETFEAWREGMHDDLVLAVALAVWAGERFLGGAPWEPPPGSGRDRSVIASAPPGVFESAPRSKESRYDDPDGDEDEGVGDLEPEFLTAAASRR